MPCKNETQKQVSPARERLATVSQKRDLGVPRVAFLGNGIPEQQFKED